jgi:hypothetical protein
MSLIEDIDINKLDLFYYFFAGMHQHADIFLWRRTPLLPAYIDKKQKT